MSRRRRERELKQPRITVIGEGLTERWYTEHLRTLKGYKYDCKPRFFTHQSLDEMRKLIDWVIQSGGIAVCICDADITRTDKEQNKRLQELKTLYAKDDRVLICDSMPSIEFWFLIHFINTRRFFKDANEVIRVLRRYIPGYEKTGAFLEKIQWVANMSSDSHMKEACKRASLLGSDSESYSNLFRALALFSKTVINETGHIIDSSSSVLPNLD